MIVDQSAAVFDTDFIHHICETKLDMEKICTILCRLLQTMQLQGVMHPLVYKNELLQNNRTRELFDQKVIAVPSFAEIFQGDPAKQIYYCAIMPELYKRMNGKVLPPDWDVLSSWAAKENLGEIHAITMCFLCGCALFLSDDGDSKKLKNLVEGEMPHALTVYNRAEFMEQFGALAGISRAERKSLAHKRV